MHTYLMLAKRLQFLLPPYCLERFFTSRTTKNLKQERTSRRPRIKPSPDEGYFVVETMRWPYQIHRSKRRRRTIGLTIGRDGQICVMAPLRTQISEIEGLVQRQHKWLQRRLYEHQKEQNLIRKELARPDERTLYLGRDLDIKLSHHGHQSQGCTLEDSTLSINLHEAPTSKAEKHHTIHLELLLWYKKQARLVFEKRAKYWSDKLNLKYKKFVLSNPQRLWGSCSAQNDIRINWRLIMAPPELLDYVIVHELCHIIHKNHSSRFWLAVEKAMPDYQIRRRRLSNMASILAW